MLLRRIPNGAWRINFMNGKNIGRSSAYSSSSAGRGQLTRLRVKEIVRPNRMKGARWSGALSRSA